MVTIDTYVNDTIKLVRSLLIKSDDLAIHINKELIKIYGTSILGDTPDNKTTWKYYMNMCGIYHKIDNPIKILVIETGAVKDLTLELLEEYPSTKNELLKFDLFYNELIDEFPNDELLIKGIIFNFDLDDVISKEDGSIVAYSRYFIEEQESNLFLELDEYCINYFKRWFIRDYAIIEDLYLASVLGTLYSKLVLKILNVRFSNIYTSNIHTFHIHEFFRSHFDLDVSILNKNTTFWLYKNIKYIRKHIGTNQTLNLIIDKILTNNGIGVGEVELVNSLPDLDLLENNDVGMSMYNSKTNEFITKPRNSYYYQHFYKSETSNITPATMVALQLDRNLMDTDLILRDTRAIYDMVDIKLDKNIIHRQKTKTFKLSIDKKDIVIQKTTAKLVLDNWVNMINKNTFRTTKEFLDENTGIKYEINAKQALYIIFKLLGKYNNIENVIVTGYNATKCFHNNITKEYLTTGLMKSDILDTMIDKFIEAIPQELICYEDGSFREYVDKVSIFNSMFWNISSNTTDMLLNSDLQVVYNRMFKKKYINLNNFDTVDKVLESENIDFVAGLGYDCLNTIKRLFKLFVDLELDDEAIEEELNKYINITKKLSSYTIQFISDIPDTGILSIRYHGLSSIKSGLVDLKSGVFRALELFYGFLDTVSVPLGEFMKAEDAYIKMEGFKYVNPPKLMMYGSSINSKPNLVGYINSYVNIYNPEIDIVNVKEDELSVASSENMNVNITEDNINVIITEGKTETTLISDINSNVSIYKPSIENEVIKKTITDNYTDLKIAGKIVENIDGVMYDMPNETTVISNVNKGIDIYKPSIDNETVKDDMLNAYSTNNKTTGKIDNKIGGIMYDATNETTMITDVDSGVEIYKPKVDNEMIDDTIENINDNNKVKGDIANDVDLVTTVKVNNDEDLIVDNSELIK